MLKKKAITVLTMSVVLATAIGFCAPHKRVNAEFKEVAYVEQDPVATENATLVLNQKSGSNDVSLVLEFSDEYDKSVTSFEALIQLDYNKIKNVTMNWNKEFTTNHCRYTYDKTTGKLKLYVVDNKDLLNDRKITIGNMSLVSDETRNFNSFVVLEELKTVDLQHKSDVVTVDRTTHKIEFTVSQLPSSTDKPSTGSPSIGTPSTGTPSTGTPSTGTPSTGTPSTGTPSTGTPSTGTPSTGTPPTGTPSTGSSSTGTPSTQAPSTGTPTTDAPSIGTPSMDNSSTEVPGATPSTVVKEESNSSQESFSDEEQNDNGQPGNSETISKFQGTAITKLLLKIVCIIGVILLVLFIVFFILKLRKGKFTNKQ